jgi:acid phosphatase (class A)
MSKRSLRLACLVAVFGVAAASSGLAQTAPVKAQKVLMALTSQDIDARRLIPPPPTEDSARQARDLAEVKAVIAASTPKRRAQAKWDDDHEDPSMYEATIGGGFELQKLPATAALMAVVMNDQSIAASAAKKAFPRKRPWAADRTIATCDPDDKPLTSYPSGHATMGYTVGVVLATLIPEKASAIQTRAADYAESREVCGSHYSSDAEASHVLGTALAIELLNTDSLRPKIDAARAELRAKGFTAQ